MLEKYKYIKLKKQVLGSIRITRCFFSDTNWLVNYCSGGRNRTYVG